MDLSAKIPAEDLTKIAARAFKRWTGQPVGIKDYNKIWAEAAVPQRRVTDQQAPNNEATLFLRMTAVRTGDDQWELMKEKYCPTHLGNRQNSCVNIPFMQEDACYNLQFFPTQIMNTAAVLKLMQEHDPEPRNKHQHYSRALELSK